MESKRHTTKRRRRSNQKYLAKASYGTTVLFYVNVRVVYIILLIIISLILIYIFFPHQVSVNTSRSVNLLIVVEFAKLFQRVSFVDVQSHFFLATNFAKRFDHDHHRR